MAGRPLQKSRPTPPGCCPLRPPPARPVPNRRRPVPPSDRSAFPGGADRDSPPAEIAPRRLPRAVAGPASPPAVPAATPGRPRTARWAGHPGRPRRARAASRVRARAEADRSAVPTPRLAPTGHWALCRDNRAAAPSGSPQSAWPPAGCTNPPPRDNRLGHHGDAVRPAQTEPAPAGPRWPRAAGPASRANRPRPAAAPRASSGRVRAQPRGSTRRPVTVAALSANRSSGSFRGTPRHRAAASDGLPARPSGSSRTTAPGAATAADRDAPTRPPHAAHSPPPHSGGEAIANASPPQTSAGLLAPGPSPPAPTPLPPSSPERTPQPAAGAAAIPQPIPRACRRCGGAMRTARSLANDRTEESGRSTKPHRGAVARAPEPPGPGETTRVRAWTNRGEFTGA